MSAALSLIKALARVGFEVKDKAGNTSNYSGPTIEQAIENARRAEGVP